jgi:hypothetical protein
MIVSGFKEESHNFVSTCQLKCSTNLQPNYFTLKCTALPANANHDEKGCLIASQLMKRIQETYF